MKRCERCAESDARWRATIALVQALGRLIGLEMEPGPDYPSAPELVQKVHSALAEKGKRIAELEAAVEDLLYQFGYRCQHDGHLALYTGGLSAFEGGFDVLHWDDPHPIPECECDEPGCSEQATSGTPTSTGYRNTCGKHRPDREPKP